MKKLFYLKQLQFITLIITVIVIFITSAISSFAVSLEEIENQINKNESHKESINNQLSSLKEQIEAQKKQDSAITAEMAAVLKEKQQEKDKLKQMLEDLDYIYEQIEEYYENIEETEKRYNEALKAFYSRAKIMYQYSQYNSLRLFVESKDYFDYVNREKIFSKMMNNDRAALQELMIMKKDLENKKAVQEQFKLDAEKLISEKQAVIKAIENNESNIYEKLEISKNAIDTLEAQEQAMIEESKNIEKKIQELEKMYEEYSYSSSGLMWPSRDSTRIASYYGWREVHPVYGYGRMHYGIDIDAAYGTDILSSADGVVTLVLFDDVGYGWYIIVYHGDGISTLYAHCSKVLVKEGQNVKQGQVLGLVGTTGASTGPHIHYEVRVNGKPQNPLDYVKPK
ncbi:MAG: peptidoglycan DD-metalloendopeptidase family protein [Clostridia bacterium]|nr:peptidoglycan DD-metalloendopeptidase family protein [Clostridia bacterium]